MLASKCNVAHNQKLLNQLVPLVPCSYTLSVSYKKLGNKIDNNIALNHTVQSLLLSQQPTCFVFFKKIKLQNSRIY